jgi:prepilin signal peptidase PulO-like enzyme (type II secretory pathway)
MNYWDIAPILATALVGLDCFTTYRGVYVKKIATEGDSFIFTKWAAAKPWRLLLPPLIPGVLIPPAAISNFYVQAAVTGLAIGIVVKSAIAVIHNLKINKGF